ncbi:uncharacterized protein LOC121867864 [Homarus americanus]|uniref:uncharacterized protein LOC121867864 n=1 Tax=Homarus americanus TaxID=6706 RepID=UPI001C448DFF|nr:uncharacterized protein LOC121867864 [Homarus americanus]
MASVQTMYRRAATTMGGKDGEKKGETEVFSEDWMNKCYKGLIYPNPTCVQVMDQVNRALAKHVTRPQGSELKQQALFTLLGPEFTTQHFPYHKYNVQILEPPLAPRQKEKYVQEARVFLDQALSRALTDCGYPEDASAYENDDELGRFLHEVRSNFQEGLRRHTAVVRFEEEAERERQKNGGDSNNEDDEGNDTDDEMEKAKRKALKEDLGTKPSDVAGQALLAILAQNNNKKNEYMKRLRERHLGLSNNLRCFFWWEFLIDKEAAKLKPKPDQDVKALMRDKFNKTLDKEMKSQKVTRAIRSNNWRTIDSAVIEAYDNTSPLRCLDNEEHMIQTARALNILNIHSKIFSNIHIYWLVPLQQAFPKKPDEEDEEHVIRQAMLLELVTRHCQMSQKEVFAVAEQIMEVMKKNDTEYYDHITRCLNNQVSRINLKVSVVVGVMDGRLLPEVLTKDLKGSVKQYQELLERGTKDMKPKHLKIFTDPAIFIRMWIAQAFVGVLSVSACVWVWDQLFLGGWKKETMKDIVGYPDAHQTMDAESQHVFWRPQDKPGVMWWQVLLDEPGKLYLSDLRRTLAHMESGGSYSDSPDNKNYLDSKTVKQPSKKQAQDQGEAARSLKGDDGKQRTPSKGEEKEKTKAPKLEEKKQPDDKKPVNKKPEEKQQPTANTSSGPQSTEASAAVLPFAPDRIFDIDLDLDSDSDDDEELPIPEPPPDTESESEPTPPPTPTPPRTPTPPPPPPEHNAWLPHEKDKTDPQLPSPTRATEPCDFYIDAVRFLPDNITHCKPKESHKESLGPLLFLCYVNDMPISVNCTLLLYAGNSALLVLEAKIQAQNYLKQGSEIHILPEFKRSLNMLSVTDRVKQLRLNHACKIFNGLCPEYLTTNFVRIMDMNRQGSRRSEHNFILPSVRGQAKNIFYFTAIIDWNKIPDHIKTGYEIKPKHIGPSWT